MLSSLFRFIKDVDARYGMVAYLGFLLVFSSAVLGHFDYLWRGLLVVVFYTAFDLLLTYLKSKVWYLPLSSWVSGLILALIAVPAPSLNLVVFLPALAVFSKHFIRHGGRHIFNPAAFAVGIASFFTPAVSWWAVSWAVSNPFLITALIFGGLFILWKQKRFSTAGIFLTAYLFLLAVLFTIQNTNVTQLPIYLKAQLIDGTLIFFITVMLIEPKTSSFYPNKNQMIYGVLVAVGAVVITAVASATGALAQFDPLVFGLLFGNLLGSVLLL